MENEVLRQIHQRKSVRAFEEREIPPEVKNAVLDAAIQAPSAGNMALYTVLDITDRSMKDALAKSCDNQPFIATAPMVLIFCADYRRWYDVFCRHGAEVREPSVGDLFLAQADAIIAAQNAVMAAHSLGLGSCYIGDITEHFEYHRQLLSLPQYVVPAAMLVLGYPTQQQKDRKKPARFAREDLVHENGYDLEKSHRMEKMLQHRDEKDDLHDWIVRFCNRKWNSDFSREMSRSCGEMVRTWCEKE